MGEGEGLQWNDQHSALVHADRAQSSQDEPCQPLPGVCGCDVGLIVPRERESSGLHAAPATPMHAPLSAVGRRGEGDVL